MPADRANDQEVFLTLKDVMKEKCLDFATTLFGLDEKTIEQDFKAVDSDEDGKLTLEEGLKVYELNRLAKFGYKCCFECCHQTPHILTCNQLDNPGSEPLWDELYLGCGYPYHGHYRAL